MERIIAKQADLEAVSRTIARAFATDPVWAVALARPDGQTDHHESYWRLFVEGAAAHGTVFLADGGAAVSVWLPPGADELGAAGRRELERYLDEALDPAAVVAMHELYDRFEASRSSVPAEHAYLSLLATHPDHRGRGIGQDLLAADLLDWDLRRIPAYLESTNPGNDHRYMRAGFVPIGAFTAIRDPAPITAMWRDIGGSGTAGIRG
ncbi:MAG: GNAT family N-acetyltransferase [Chloroflexota bacterium]|jgi:GNAT superfamily N-acetyltransferase|nr:GNAT family N-acetyltransferase [Chloroflexota bacterium]MDH5242308.1 GNAT family N-acetyltransferase [Chloroflexota bacterium]